MKNPDGAKPRDCLFQRGDVIRKAGAKSDLAIALLLDDGVRRRGGKGMPPVAIGCIPDIGNHNIVEREFETPDDNEDRNRIPGEEAVLPSGFHHSLRNCRDDFRAFAKSGIDYPEKDRTMP